MPLKTFPTLLATILAFNLSAQNPAPRIKASDPTLLLTQVNFSAGINFNDYSPEVWEFNFGGTWAIKDKFSFGFTAPITNNALSPSIFERLELNAAYQIHYNTGLFNSSLISIGLTSPITDDYFIRYIRGPYSASYEFRASYTAGIKISEKLSFYPHLEYYRRLGDSREYTVNQSGQFQSGLVLNHQGLRTGAIMSYDFNRKNFIQLGVTYCRGRYNQNNVPEGIYDHTGITLDRYDLRFRYQYAFKAHSQIFLELNQQFHTISPGDDDWQTNRNLSNFFIGYSYFLD